MSLVNKRYAKVTMYSDRQISKIKDILDMEKVMAAIPKKALTKIHC